MLQGIVIFVIIGIGIILFEWSYRKKNKELDIWINDINRREDERNRR